MQAYFAPVPGNYKNTVKLEKLYKGSTTYYSKGADLSNCVPLKTIQILFIAGPIRDYMCHTPMLPILPKKCRKIIDVIPSYHLGPQWFKINYQGDIWPYIYSGALAFHQVLDFLKSFGIEFNFTKYKYSNLMTNDSKENKEQIIKVILERVLADRSSRRSMFSKCHLFYESNKS